MGRYIAAGGEIDGVMLDMETGFSVWSFLDDPQASAATLAYVYTHNALQYTHCKRNRYDTTSYREGCLYSTTCIITKACAPVDIIYTRISI